MITGTPPSQKPVAVTTYIIVSAISLAVAIGIGYYYLHYMKQSGNEKMDDRVFYLVLILFGVAASALIFGIMNSYATLKGIQSNVTYKFTGPVVGVILTVVGGFTLSKGPTDKILSVKVYDEDNHAITKGKVGLSFSNYQREASIDEKGMAVFPDIPYEQVRKKIIINVASDGYASITIDTLLSNFDPIKITLYQSKIIRLTGKITDAADRPIKDVEVTVDGTQYFAKTINDGSFDIPIPGYHFGDRITLVTSHPAYEDKTKEFDIETGEINKIEFVLNPIPHKRR